MLIIGRSPLVVVTALCLAESAYGQLSISWTKPQLQEIARREKQVSSATVLDRKWFHVSSKDYEAYSEVDPRFTAELSLFMDLFHEQFRAVIKEPLRVKKRPQVFIYATQEGFKERLKSSARGWYRYRFGPDGEFTEHALFSYIEKPEEKKFLNFYHPILLHEGTHQVLQEVVGARDIPPWFGEGLATYFQLWDLRVAFDLNQKRRPLRLINSGDFYQSWKDRGFPSLAELQGLTSSEWDADDMGPIAKRHYSAGESLFIFLMASEAGLKEVMTCLRQLVEGRTPEIGSRSRDAERIEKEWRTLVEKRLAPLARANAR